MNLTQERLKELLRYDPQTGVFTWLVSPGNRVPAGAIAGGPMGGGRWHITVCGVLYLAHRLAWLWMTGAWPKLEIDHRNGVGSDNKWTNLREADRPLNMENLQCAHRDNGSGFLGVSRKRGAFEAQIQINGKKQYLGTFPDPVSAHAAYLEAKRKFHPGCTI